MYLAVRSFQHDVSYIATKCVCMFQSAVFSIVSVMLQRSVCILQSAVFNIMSVTCILRQSVYVSCSPQFSTLCQLFCGNVCMYLAVRSFQHDVSYIVTKCVCMLQSAVFSIVPVILQRSVCILQSAVFNIMSVTCILRQSMYISCSPQFSTLCQLFCGNVCMYLAVRKFSTICRLYRDEVCMYLAVRSFQHYVNFQRYVSYIATKCVCILLSAIFNIMSVILQQRVYVSSCVQFLTLCQL